MVRAVLASIRHSDELVPFPDHPLLLRGPDVLASNDGRLVAYFVFSRPMNGVIADLILARLGLPSETRFVLASNEQPTLSDDSLAFFDEIMLMRGRSDQELGTMPIDRTGNFQVIESIRGIHHERFADAWASTTRHWHRRRPTPGMASSLLHAERSRLMAKYMDFDNGELIFAPPDSATWRSEAASLRSAMTAAVRADYNLDNGTDGMFEVSDLIRSGDAHLALHRGRLHYRPQVRSFDPSKPFRAAAFAGFAMKGMGGPG
jgi:hypothetical protein